MPSNPQLDLMTSLIQIEGFKVADYHVEDGIGIFVSLVKQDPKVTCPCCGKLTDKLHQNHWYWVRDLPFGEQPVHLNINRRQMRCPSCGKKFSEELKGVIKKRKYTVRFRTKIVEEALEGDIKNVAKRHEVSEQEVQTMLKDVGKELIEEKPKGLKRLGIDEIAIIKGQKNYYVVLVDLDKRKLIGVIEKRTKGCIKEYLEAWGEEVLSQIEEVSIDLWKPYKSISEELIEQAEIVADRFHVMKQVNGELDRERKSQKREAEKIEEESKREEMLSTLKKSKYALLKNEEDLNEEQQEKLEEIAKVLPSLIEKYQLKEEFRKIFENSEDRKEGLDKIIGWIRKARVNFPESCKTIENWLSEIIAYFERGTTQGIVEGINNKLKLIKRKAYGFRNFENFRLRSLLNWCFAD